MIPSLSQLDLPKDNFNDFIHKLRDAGFSGDICSDYATRLVTATDNSVYQLLPQAVIYPHQHSDVVLVMQLVQQSQFQTITITARGAGTGTNGQSLTTGIIIDFTRYMNHILELDLEASWVSVEPGVVLDQLNEYLKPYGVFVPLTISTSNRATIGGMINTDACGKGSCIYGRTHDHIKELTCILNDGAIIRTREISASMIPRPKKRTKPISARLRQELGLDNDRVIEIYQQIYMTVNEHKSSIQKQFPKLTRNMTGYNLSELYNQERDSLNLSNLIAGSEGTLAIVTAAKLKLTPIPAYKKLIAITYPNFNCALEHAKEIIKAQPLAIESMDEVVYDLAKTDLSFQLINEFMPASTANDNNAALTLVEFCSNNELQLHKIVKDFCQQLENHQNAESDNITLSYYVAKNDYESELLWTLRKKSVGLLGKTKGNRKPISGIEDTVVNPQDLANYVTDIKTILDEYDLRYGIFGHMDVGCLHIRPALDMRNPKDEIILQEITERVVALVKHYNGLMWGEHGKGFRSEYNPDFFGKVLYGELQKIKTLFDPYNQLNPGKVATSLTSNTKLASINGPKRGHLDRQILPGLARHYANAIACNGNGVCFNYQTQQTICPSYKATRDHRHSPKGRAALTREWLRQLSVQNYSVKHVNIIARLQHACIKFANYFRRNHANDDFSHQVHEAFSGCLGCKACASDCPVQINVPEFKSKFLALYHSRYPRSLRSHLIAYSEQTSFFMSKFPKLSRRLLTLNFVKQIAYRYLHLVDLPLPSYPGLKQLQQQADIKPTKISELLRKRHLHQNEQPKSVIVLQDWLTSHYDSRLLICTHELLSELGYQVHIAPLYINGKAFHAAGRLRKFRRYARKNSQLLKRLASCEIPIIGIDPSITLTYRDEYRCDLPESNNQFVVMLVQEWLATQLNNLIKGGIFTANQQKNHSPSYFLLTHCSENSLLPQAQTLWVNIFHAFNLNLIPITSGCCGMAGSYGHESEHYALSQKIFKQTWQQHIGSDKYEKENFLVTGFSCREQVKRFAGFTPRHPLEALHAHICQQRSK